MVSAGARGLGENVCPRIRPVGHAKDHSPGTYAAAHRMGRSLRDNRYSAQQRLAFPIACHWEDRSIASLARSTRIGNARGVELLHGGHSECVVQLTHQNTNDNQMTLLAGEHTCFCTSHQTMAPVGKPRLFEEGPLPDTCFSPDLAGPTRAAGDRRESGPAFPADLHTDSQQQWLQDTNSAYQARH